MSLEEDVVKYFPELAGVWEEEFTREAFEALLRLLPHPLRTEPLVIGSYLLKIVGYKDTAGHILVDAWKLNSSHCVKVKPKGGV